MSSSKNLNSPVMPYGNPGTDEIRVEGPGVTLEQLGIKTVEFHPIAEIFPLMSKEDLATLTTDIARNGLLEPIIVYEGKVIDGRNRYRACIKANVKPRFVEWPGSGNPLPRIMSMNYCRRHLTASQKSMIASQVGLMAQKDKTLKDALTNGDLARRVGVSKTSMSKTNKVLQKGTPELVQAVTKGAIAADIAAELAELPRTKQRDAIKKGRKDAIKIANEIRRSRKLEKALQLQHKRHQMVQSAQFTLPRGKNYNVFQASIEDHALQGNPLYENVADDSVALIATGPPFASKTSTYASLARFAERVLLDNENGCGSLLVFVDNHRIPEILKAMCSDTLKYVWTICYKLNKNNMRFDPGITIWWHPVLWFVKNGKRFDKRSYAPDMIHDKRTKEEKEQQIRIGAADCEPLIRKLTLPNQLVVDPFCREGSILIPAALADRNWMGFDPEEDACILARERLMKALKG